MNNTYKNLELLNHINTIIFNDSQNDRIKKYSFDNLIYFVINNLYIYVHEGEIVEFDVGDQYLKIKKISNQLTSSYEILFRHIDDMHLKIREWKKLCTN